jgi:hypothetical protein
MAHSWKVQISAKVMAFIPCRRLNIIILGEAPAKDGVIAIENRCVWMADGRDVADVADVAQTYDWSANHHSQAKPFHSVSSE